VNPTSTESFDNSNEFIQFNRIVYPISSKHDESGA